MVQKVTLTFFCLVVLSLTSCKSGDGGNSSNVILSADAVANNARVLATIKNEESQKISNQINNALPDYSISDSELKDIQSEGLISNDELKELKTIQ